MAGRGDGVRQPSQSRFGFSAHLKKTGGTYKLLKLSVGISKKVGQPDYGLLGASCFIEVELDQSLIFDDLEGFQDRVKHAYVACRQAVSDELGRQQHSGGIVASNGSAGAPGSGHLNGKLNGHATVLFLSDALCNRFLAWQ